LPEQDNPNTLYNIDPVYDLGISRNCLKNASGWRLKAVDFFGRPELLVDPFLEFANFRTPIRMSFCKHIQPTQDERLKLVKLNVGNEASIIYVTGKRTLNLSHAIQREIGFELPGFWKIGGNLVQVNHCGDNNLQCPTT
jgi:hypothetical protein